MKHVVARLLFILLFACAGAVAPLCAAVSLSVAPERGSALYAVGETVRFVVKASGLPSEDERIRWTLTRDGATRVDSGYVVMRDGVAEVVGKLDGPGFLQCRVVLHVDGKREAAGAAVGVGVEDIEGSLPEPEGFDAFWADARAGVEREKSPPVLTEMPETERNGRQLVVRDVQAPSPGGAPVSGYLAWPKGAAPRSLPAILTLHGAGVGSAKLDTAVGWASEGLLAMDINAHGLPNGRPKEFYAELAEGALKDYRLRGRDNPKDVYFLGMYQRVWRALDLLSQRPEWDGRTLIVQGTSQGGGQALAAALHERVSLIVAGLPAYCDPTAAVAGRAPGWVKFVQNDEQGRPDPVALQTARYFDSVHFARRARAQVFFTVGFVDATCPPSTVYAAYNAVGAPKAIFNDITSGHRNSREAIKRMREAVLAHVRERSALE